MFPLTPDSDAALARWMEEQDRAVAVRQRRPRPYYGASGGAVSFGYRIGTSIGAARHALTGSSIAIDLADPVDLGSIKNVAYAERVAAFVAGRRSVTLIETPTSLGASIVLHDDDTGHEEDITDYDW